ncbi:ABC transporter ATP-binding protein [Vibrio coralliilyticus OCN008]|uniref:ATP-binding cassette domain-containing protein n=1 Tax=Vibrio coralliilyticus TaxID=190893 RepID=UPI000390B1A1|nr:ABC transporter ATP-binding protein [Vibrio coralliilyticus]ERB63659.1 ABC transporter permease [Vibrio coralliilyticus OCN008]QIJ86742.1 ABC transporter ATP-binding protein [Vibrio coralliilyticus OCN008]
MLLSKDMRRGEALKAMLQSERRQVALSLGSAVMCSLVEVVPWVCLLLSLEAMASGESPILYLLVFVIALLGRYGLYAFAVWLAHLAAYQIIQKTRQHIVRALASMKIEQLRSQKRGDIEKRLSDDCQSLEPLIAHHGTDVINGLLMPALLTILMGYIDWRLALIALLPLPVALGVQIMLMSGFRHRQEKYMQIVANMHQAQMEFLRSIGVMKLFSVDADSYLALSRTIRSHNKIVTGYTRMMVGAWVTFVTLAQASLMLVVPAAIAFVQMGQLSHAELVMVVCISAGILKPWLDLTQVFSQIQQSFVAVDRLLPFFHTTQTVVTSYDAPLESLSCAQLTLSRADNPLLNDVNVEFYPGERVTIEGESGVGKSSWLMTLSGALTADSGEWRVNGASMKDWDDATRSRYIASVDQQVVFFSGSLRDNLSLVREALNDDELWSLLSLMRLKDVVLKLPQGLDSPIGEAQRLFSGGEMQRLAIVRAALAKTPVLILDEATAHLDQISEQTVLEGLRQYHPEQIQLIISHRATRVQQVNRRLRVEAGEVQESRHD